MKRRSDQARAHGGSRVALFPFLAVLVCTMGALILVLVVLARQARVQASRAAQTKQAEVASDLATARDMVRWRISVVADSRQKTEEQLAEARLRLGHVEQHARQLHERLRRLQADWAELEKIGPTPSDRQNLEAERNRLEQQIAEARQRLDEARRAAAGRAKSYAILPYEGPRGTARRPIYLECRADAVVIQPEGIELAPEDFEKPLGPQNPLASALRAAREHLAARGPSGDGAREEPYPLLIVRPEGIVAFCAAREAMKSWGAEFGYELVGSDWNLRYPQPDPELNLVVQKAVAAARTEQRQLAMLLAGAGGSGRSAERPKAIYRAAPGGGGLIREDGREGAGARPGEGQRPPSGSAGKAAPPGRPAPRPRGVLPPEKPDDPRDANPAGGVALRPGEWVPYERPPKRPEAADEKSPKSLAASRGKNWALPDATRNSVPITRSIRVACHADRLVVFGESRGDVEQIVQLGARMEDSIDQLISAVWEHIKRWGVAGRGMYWRPVLAVDVAPGAEARYAELKTLLEESGVDVERPGEPRSASRGNFESPTPHR
ncbi:MAG: hypothetical protein NUV77_11020 [Thermoguttaceae bacterium]|jgi:hypothetical protein|nr:hypothetical protein [Thermoguttaceae bacterium]